MFTLKDLTPEIRAKIPEYKEKCVKDLYSGVEHANYNEKMVIEYIHKLYEITKNDLPVIIVADNPTDYAEKFRSLNNKNNVDVANAVEKAYKKLKKDKNISNDVKKIYDMLENKTPDMSIKIKSHYLFLCSAYHRVYLMWYKFIQDEFKIEHTNQELLDWLYEKANNNILRCYFTKQYVLVLRMPKYIRRNNIGFHSIDDAAIDWLDYKMYYINGRKLSEKLFMSVKNKTLTFDDFINLDNEDTKAAVLSMMNEKFGGEYLKDFLGAVVVDERTIVHSSGHQEKIKLWKTKKVYNFLNDINGNMNQPYAWIEFTCPTSESKYLIQTSPHFTDALEAAKFHRPEIVEMDMEYDFEEFNN